MLHRLAATVGKTAAAFCIKATCGAILLLLSSTTAMSANAAGMLFDAAEAVASGVTPSGGTWSYVTSVDGSETPFTPTATGHEVEFAPRAGTAVITRFTVAEAGWYSAVAEFRALGAGDALVQVLVNGEVLSAGRCSTEIKRAYSFVFRTQVTPRQLADGGTVEFKLIPTAAWAKESVAVRAVVRKETPGAFFDLGAAMLKSVENGLSNPVSDMNYGTWSFVYRYDGGRLYRAGGKKVGMGAGFVHADYQQFYVNTNGTIALTLADWEATPRGELNIHPQYFVNTDAGADCPDELLARFYPPRAGWYTGCLALRSTGFQATVDTSDGGYGRIFTGRGTEITNVFYRGSNAGLHSNMAEFGPFYLAAGEPVDFVADPGPSRNNGADRALGSLVYRYVGDGELAGKIGYDCAAALTDNALASANRKPSANPITLSDGSKWSYGISTEAPTSSAFTAFPMSQAYISGTSLGFSNLTSPYYNQILVRTNLEFSVTTLGAQSYGVTRPIVSRTLNVHPSVPADSVARFTPARDGRYTVKMMMFSVAMADDQVNYYTVVNGQFLGKIIDKQVISYEKTCCPAYDIPTLVFRNLDLHAGDDVRLVIDAGANQGQDRSGGGFAVIREGDIPADAAAEVVNFAFNTPGDSGNRSAFTAAGAFGRPGGTATWNTYASAPDKHIAAVSANGTTVHKLTFAFDGTAPAVGTKSDSAYALVNGYFTTTPDADYAFTIGNLVPGETYALCFYSAQGKATRGNAVFTVGGETRAVNGVEQTATVNNNTMVTTAYDGNCRFDVQSNCYVRFDDVTADAKGEIHGTFACAADKTQAAFNGFSIRGRAYKKYYGAGTVLVVR